MSNNSRSVSSRCFLITEFGLFLWPFGINFVCKSVFAVMDMLKKNSLEVLDFSAFFICVCKTQVTYTFFIRFFYSAVRYQFQVDFVGKESFKYYVSSKRRGWPSVCLFFLTRGRGGSPELLRKH